MRPCYDAVLEHARVGKATRLLDVGCGAGMAAQLAHARGATIAGLDASEPLLAIARERAPHGEFRHGDLEQLPWPDASFDVVTGFNSFQYAADPKRALAEAKRVVRRGGSVFIVTWGQPDGMEAAACSHGFARPTGRIA
jgi:ubiquinone/menaquinone biosynthesis C-methylase UbiE